MAIFHQPHNSMENHSYNIYIYDRIDYDLHFHKNYEFIYVIEGAAVCTVNGKTKRLTEGEFALCLSNEIHSIRSLGASRVWIGVFSEDFISEFSKQQKGRGGVDFSFFCAPSVLAFLKEHLIREDAQDLYLLKACLYALCSEYTRQIPPKTLPDKSASVVGEIVSYVEAQYQNPISLATLAKSLGYETCYFSKLFHKLFSMRFNDYINIYRFNAACTMLLESDRSVTEISYACGFQSVRTFNNTFKRLAATSPSRWRALRRSQKMNIST